MRSRARPPGSGRDRGRHRSRWRRRARRARRSGTGLRAAPPADRRGAPGSPAQPRDRVELAGRPRELVVDGREHLLVDLLHARRDPRLLPIRKPVVDLFLSAGLLTHEPLFDLGEQTLRAELDDVVALGLSVGRDEIDDDRVALTGRPAVGGGEIRNRGAEHLELGVDQLVGHLGLGRGHFERGPVGHVRQRLNADGRGELEAFLLRRRQLVVVLGRRRGPDGRPAQRSPEPAADVALDRLGVETVLADASDEHGHRHLAFAKSRDLQAPGEIRGGVVNRVLDVAARDLDRHPDLALGELFDRRLHEAAIVPAALGAGDRAPRSARGE